MRKQVDDVKEEISEKISDYENIFWNIFALLIHCDKRRLILSSTFRWDQT